MYLDDTDCAPRISHPSKPEAGSRAPRGADPQSPCAPSPGYLIYAIEELASGRHYVGLTRRSLAERVASHLSQARRDRRIRPGGLMSAIQLMDALGQRFADCFSARIVARADTADEARGLERLWIDRLECRAPAGFNQMPGGSSVGGLDNARSLSFIGQDGVERTCATIGQAIAVCNAERVRGGLRPLGATTVYARLAGGWPPEEALGLQSRRYAGSVRRTFAIGDTVFTTLKEANEATGIPSATLASRLHRLGKAASAGMPQIGEDRRTRLTGQLPPLDIPWPASDDRLTAAAFGARTGIPKATVIHRWHRAQTLLTDGRLTAKELHAFMTGPNRRTGKPVASSTRRQTAEP